MRKAKIIFITAMIVVGLALFLVVTVFGVQNNALSYEEQAYTAQSALTIQEQRRADLIPNLVDCVKAYDEYEYAIIMSIINTRGTNSDQSIDEITTMIDAVAEAYPELKSSENYRQLMSELTTAENLIADCRSNYNNCVKQYKQYIRKFPNWQILNLLGYEPVDYFYLYYGGSEDALTDLFDD